MTFDDNYDNTYSGVEPIHVLKARLDFESDAWSSTTSAFADPNALSRPSVWNIWTDALDPARGTLLHITAWQFPPSASVIS